MSIGGSTGGANVASLGVTRGRDRRSVSTIARVARGSMAQRTFRRTVKEAAQKAQLARFGVGLKGVRCG